MVPNHYKAPNQQQIPGRRDYPLHTIVRRLSLHLCCSWRQVSYCYGCIEDKRRQTKAFQSPGMLISQSDIPFAALPLRTLQEFDDLGEEKLEVTWVESPYMVASGCIV